MGHQISKLTAALCLLLVSGEAWSARIVMDNRYVNDSDGARQYSYLLGADQDSDTPFSGGNAGFRAGQWRIKDRAGEETFEVVKLNYDSGSARPWRARLGATQLLGDWSPSLGEAMLSATPAKRWYLEAAAQREIIDTVTAVRAHYLADTLSASADYQLNDEFTLVGGLFTQSISDGNQRLGKIGRLIYSPARWEGVNLQGRVKIVDSDFNGTGYFSPGQLSEYMLLAGMSTSLFAESWVIGGQLGIGAQQIDNNDYDGLYYGEIKARGWFSERLGLDGKFSCSNAGEAGFGQGAANYRYCLMQLSLIGVW